MKKHLLKNSLIWGIIASMLLSLTPAYAEGEADGETAVAEAVTEADDKTNSEASPKVPEVIKVDLEEIDNYRQIFEPVDIRAVSNRGFADDAAGDGIGGWADQGPTNDMACFKLYGNQKFAGMQFEIINPKENDGKSAIVLRGQNDKSVPDEVVVPVGKKAKGVYFLHASPWLGGSEQVGSYTLVFDDGTEYAVDLFGGEEVFNWWNTDRSDSAIVGWSGKNDSSTVSLAVFPVANPYPDKVIKEIKAATIGIGPYLCIAGISLTDSGPYLPVEKIENIGNPDTTNWYPYQPCEDPSILSGTPIDMSKYIEKPSGKHGHTVVKGDELYFEDGTPTQFWGICMTQECMFMNKEDAEKTALRMAQLGFNLVRFHGIATGPSTSGSIDLTSTDMRRTGQISKEHMDQLCYFLNELKKNGIYYGFDLPTASLSMWKNNNFHDIENIASAQKGPNWFDEEAIALNDTLAKQMLTYVNPYNGLSLANDPSALFVALYNETHIYQITSFEWEYYYPNLKEMYNKWLMEKYGSREALAKAWTEPQSDLWGLLENEDPTQGTVDCFDNTKRRKCNSKRFLDNMRFLGDVEEQNYRTRIDRIKEYAPKLLVQGSTTCMTGLDDGASIYTNAKEGDFYSTQNYLFLAFGNGERLGPGMGLSGTPQSMMADTKLDPLGYIAVRRLYNQAQFQTEWDGALPNPYRSELMPFMGVQARMQLLNPVMFYWGEFNFTKRMHQTDKEKGILTTHALGNRPETQYCLPATSVLVLREDIKTPETGYYWERRQANEMFERTNQNVIADGTYMMVGRAGIAMDQLDYDPDYNDNNVLKLKKYGDETGWYASITDESAVDLKEQIFRVNSPRSQITAGFIGGKEIELNDVKFEMDNKFATVYMTSLTDESLHDTDSMMLTLVGDARNTGQELSEDGVQVINGGTGPLLLEPITGKVTIKSKNSYRVYPLDFTGHRKGEIMTSKDENGHTVFETKISDKTMNYEIVVSQKASDNPENEKISYIPEGVFDDLFDDLGEWEPYRKEIERIYMQGFIKAVAQKKFYPNQPITRGTAIALIMDALSFVSDVDPGFNDITKDNVYFNEICSAAAYGIVVGDTDNNFRPNDNVTREDFLCMLYRALSQTQKMRTQKRDVKIGLKDASPYAIEPVTKLSEVGYLEDFENVSLKENTTRAEAVVLLYRVLWE